VKDLYFFFESVESLNLLEQLCAYPYALLLILLRLPARPLRKRKIISQPYFLDEEFESCLDTASRPRLADLLQVSREDIRRFHTNWQAAPGHEKVYALLYLPTFILLRILCALCFAGSVRKHTTEWLQEQSHLLNHPREVRDFALQTKPLALLPMLLIPPITLLMIVCFHALAFLKLFRKSEQSASVPGDCLVLEQNVDPHRGMGPSSFFMSPVYFATLISIFACGLPGWISWYLYQHLGIDVLLGSPSADPRFYREFIQIFLYLYPLGWCLSATFFATYYTFPFNFTSSEYEIEVYPDVIKKQPIKGWFADIMLFCDMSYCPKQIFWSEVTGVKFSTGRLDGAVKDAHSLLARITNICEGITRKMDVQSDVLTISSAENSIEIRLWELSRQEKAQLFHALQKNAPSIYLDAKVQQALVGSTVLRDPRYTQIWFDILSRSGTTIESEALRSGQTVQDGKYKVLRELESGGQARVFLSEDAQGKRFVLKEFQLTPGNSLSELVESASLFERESTILSQLQHPLIVHMEEMFIQGSRVYLVVDYIEGDSIRSLVKQGKSLSESGCLKLALQMCEILEYLHSQSPPVVHRDFTPDNLIVSTDGALKLIDFSSAHQVTGDSHDCAGKHAYTPPEQFRGESSAQSDIYALGATLFYMLTGNDPEAISRSSLPAECLASAELRRIIENCSELDLEKRYESVHWLRADLLALQGNVETLAEEPLIINLGNTIKRSKLGKKKRQPKLF
jgi:hypothetical protein